MTEETNPTQPEREDEDATQDAPGNPDQTIDEGTLDDDELADEQGKESFPASDAPGNY